MADDGTSFEIDLPVVGREKIDAAALSVDVLAAKLDSVSKASAAAGAAVKAGEAAYAAAERSANAAAKALERINVAQALQRDKIKVAGAAGDDAGVAKAYAAYDKLSQAKERAAAKSEQFKTALVAEAAALDKLKSDADKTSEAEKKLSAALDKKKKGADDDEGPAYEKIARGLGKLGGPLADVGEHIAKVGSGFDKLKAAFGGAAGIVVGVTVVVVALAAAFVALSVAAVETTAKIASWAVGLADANRQSRLLAEGMAQSVKGGDALNAAVKAAARQFPLTTEQLSEMAKGFAYAGYRGKDLTNALQQSATWAARLKFGPAFAQEMLGLDQQSKVLQMNLSSVFGGLKIDGLLGALQRMIALLDTSTASGAAIKAIFEGFFQPLIDSVTASQFKVERFFLQMEIWAMKAIIAFAPYAPTVIKIGAAFAIAAAIIGGIVVGAFALLAAVSLAIVGGFALTALGVVRLVGSLYAFAAYVVGFAPKVIDTFATIGSNMIDGLVNGIIAGGSKVFAALKGIVTGAVDGVRGLLKINSPSKVFAAIGESTGEGMALGVDNSSTGVQSSFERLVKPPAVRAVPPATATAATGASSGGANFAGATFVLNGVQGADDAVSRIGDLLTILIEGDAAKLGALKPATG